MNWSLMHKAVLATKKFLHSARGEPYTIDGKTLRFIPGTRPVHVRHRESPNAVSRFEALQVDLIPGVLTTGNFAIDIGANTGQYAHIMAASCGNIGRVVAFETVQLDREQLSRNLALNPDFSPLLVEALALSDYDGSGTLYSRGEDSNSSPLV